jgi:hypothetical protein
MKKEAILGKEKRRKMFESILKDADHLRSSLPAGDWASNGVRLRNETA